MAATRQQDAPRQEAIAHALAASIEVARLGTGLLPVPSEHRGTLVVIPVTPIVVTGLALAQPILVRALIDRVGSGATLTIPVITLVAVTLGDASLRAVRSYLLRRTAEGVCSAPAVP